MLIKLWGIELIIIDDVQNLIAKRKKDTSKVLDCLVDLMNQTEVPFVFLGVENSKQILDLNQRLASKVSMFFELNQIELAKEKVQ